MKKLVRYIVILTVVTALLCLSAFALDVRGGEVEVSTGVRFRTGPSTEDGIIIESLPNATRVAVLGKENDFYKVAYDSTVGYIHQDYLRVQDDPMNVTPGNVRITTETLNVRKAPKDGSVVSKLHKGDVVEVIGINDGWYKIGDKQYICPDYTEFTGEKTTVKKNTSLRQQIVDYAANFLGVPYVWGGTTPKGFDCSGLCQYVYKHFDISICRTSAEQYKNSVRKISKSQLQPGDLVFFWTETKGVVSHVGIYVGNDTFIHAPRTGKDVMYESLSSTYYTNHYLGSGSVL